MTEFNPGSRDQIGSSSEGQVWVGTHSVHGDGGKLRLTKRSLRNSSIREAKLLSQYFLLGETNWAACRRYKSWLKLGGPKGTSTTLSTLMGGLLQDAARTRGPTLPMYQVCQLCGAKNAEGFSLGAPWILDKSEWILSGVDSALPAPITWQPGTKGSTACYLKVTLIRSINRPLVSLLVITRRRLFMGGSMGLVMEDRLHRWCWCKAWQATKAIVPREATGPWGDEGKGG